MPDLVSGSWFLTSLVSLSGLVLAGVVVAVDEAHGEAGVFPDYLEPYLEVMTYTRRGRARRLLAARRPRLRRRELDGARLDRDRDRLAA